MNGKHIGWNCGIDQGPRICGFCPEDPSIKLILCHSSRILRTAIVKIRYSRRIITVGHVELMRR